MDLRSSMPLLTAVDARPEVAGAKAAADPTKAERTASFIMITV